MIRTILLAGAAATSLAMSAPALADAHSDSDGTEGAPALTAPEIEYTMGTLDKRPKA